MHRAVRRQTASKKENKMKRAGNLCPGAFFQVVFILLLFMFSCLSCRQHRRPYLSPGLNEALSAGEHSPITAEDRRRIEAVYKFAPIIRHGAAPCWWKRHKKDFTGRYNFITRFDYDNDNKCDNNRDHLMKRLKNGKYYDLEAAVYYSIVETETHMFITYHFYHALDQAVYFPNLLRLWDLSHENDGENIQLVIRKSGSGDYIELIAMDSHIKTKIYAAAYYDRLPVKVPVKRSTKVPLCNCDVIEPVRLKMENKNNDISWKESIKKYTHPAIYIGSGKHAISSDRGRKERSDDIFFYPPVSPGSQTRFPVTWQDKDCKEYEYVLKPVRDTLWHLYINNRHLGNGGVMDGYFTYRNKERGIIYKRVPRHYRSDYIACVPFNFKSNSGILPFAFDLPGKQIKKGRLFFDPAANYRRYFKIDAAASNWSETYIYNPYLPKAAW